MSNEDLRNEIANIVSDGGYSSIRELVDLVPISKLKKEYDFLLEENDDE